MEFNCTCKWVGALEKTLVSIFDSPQCPACRSFLAEPLEWNLNFQNLNEEFLELWEKKLSHARKRRKIVPRKINY
ncbi:MAG: hypothetical protein HRU15_12655 [Planctomycetes bacterium]|nr:hypothetical protein [Planctomycetota bacterium]